MKIRFKDEKAMEEFSKRDPSFHRHNHNMVKNYGMKTFKVEIDDTGDFWDTIDGDFTIQIEDESHYFTIVEE
ncbi:hypothetical protein P19_0273 [Aeromonas phage P19]|uniref:Uncharacterized protein n=1 Tax=Aeromonas phage Asswx_1 TaxID=2419739 RepID=A0A411B7Y0_9CAUD|nr:hypothetical protein ASswx1_79 [Aeromonas phage Asswx_1]UKM62761.1 hypothetical protein P19_0273 [Aeromonas phage P19]